jgi:hypothetical protein
MTSPSQACPCIAEYGGDRQFKSGWAHQFLLLFGQSEGILSWTGFPQVFFEERQPDRSQGLVCRALASAKAGVISPLGIWLARLISLSAFFLRKKYIADVLGMWDERGIMRNSDI